MIRQAHTYLVGAMSGATLIAIAIAAFVLLVSAQVFRDWPVAALGNGDEGSISQSQSAGGAPAGVQGAALGAGAGAATAAGGANGEAGRGGGSAPAGTTEGSTGGGGGESGGGAGGGGEPSGS